MRPTLVLRIHPSPVLIPKMYSGMTLRHPSDAYKHAFWDETRRLEYEGLWKKGEWREVPEGSVKLGMVSPSSCFNHPRVVVCIFHLDQTAYIS
jgi:hypothetical protein